jgi:acetyl esterase/lipase
VPHRLDKSKSNVEFFKVKTEDGVEMDGWMVKPNNFDATKKYPVVLYVYGEPWGQNVKDENGSSFNFMYTGNMAQMVTSTCRLITGAHRCQKAASGVNLSTKALAP